MRKLFKDCRGAVTVMVTLLLIPALLISGTCVDLSRSYAARSALQDGNLMGANAWMTQYDALLQDIYGLFGVYDEDDEFSGDEMLRDYIKASIFAPEGSGGLGFFELLYDSELSGTTLTVTKNLGNVEVLRNQIEDYAKFRAPVAIASELLETLDAFEKLKADAEVIKDKIEVDQKVEDIEDSYRDLYDKLREIENESDGYPPTEAEAFQTVNVLLSGIKSKMEELKRLKGELDKITDEEKDAESKRADLREQIDKAGKELRQKIAALKAAIEKYCKKFEKFKDKITSLVALGRQADADKKELEEKLDELEKKLDSGECSQQLSSGMTPGLAEYRKLLKYNVEQMTKDMVSKDNPHIDSAIAALKGISFSGGTDDDGNAVSYAPGEFPSVGSGTDDLGSLMDSALGGKFHVDRPDGFAYFRDLSRESGEFYKELNKLFSDSGSRKKAESTTKIVRTLLKNIKNKIKKGFSMEVAGATSYPGPLRSGKNLEKVDLGTDTDWSKGDNAQDAATKMLDSDLLDRFANLAGEIGNKALLLVYDTEMFSNFTSPDEPGEYDLTMSDIPMNTRVNYFFQSELEYLFHGDKDSAKENLTVVASLLFLVRLVFNYIASYTASPPVEIVSTIEGALTLAGPFAFVVGALVRLGLVMGESFIDVIRLRSGENVAIYKNGNTWFFGGAGAVGDLMESAEEAIASLDAETSAVYNGKKEIEEKKPGEMNYRDYLRIFLLLVGGNTLALRTADLIALNLTNYETGNNAKVRTMDLRELGRFGTCITIESTLELRFLFLSMGYAQKGVNGVVPPRSMTLKSVLYRGY